MSRDNPIEAVEIPPHMIDDDVTLSAAQKKVFGKANRAAARKSSKRAARKSSSKRAAKKAAAETPADGEE